MSESIRDVVRREMQEAYDNAILSLEKERLEPEYIQEARRAALLRWLANN